MSLFDPFLSRSGVVILDGGLATELERRGLDLHDPLWSAKALIDSPDVIRQVHRAYLEAGADVITSASYQASFAGFARRGFDRQQTAELLLRSVRLALEARAEFVDESQTRTKQRPLPLVAASVGSYGAILHDGSEYRGDYGLSTQELSDWHRPRIEVLAGSGADLLACETIPSLAEAEALVRVLEGFPDVPAWISFSCRDGYHVCHGETLRACVATVNDCASVLAVGVNCTAPQLVEDLLRSIAEGTSKLLVAYPNSGENWDAAKRGWQADETAYAWADAARRWHAAGARLIGGCCRTMPATIATIAGAFT